LLDASRGVSLAVLVVAGGCEVADKRYRIGSREFVITQDVQAQLAHLCFGGSMVLVDTRFGWGWWGVAAFFLYAILKEFWIDLTFETPPDTFLGSLLDFSMYALGFGIGWAIVWFTGG
jgi:hypothetical protein